MMLTRIYIVRDAFVTQDEITIFKEMLHEFTDEDWEYEVTEWKGSGFRPTFFGIAPGIFDGVFHIGSLRIGEFSVGNRMVVMRRTMILSFSS